MFGIFRSAVMAGFTVGLAAFGYLCIGGVVGAVVFAFGLLTVVAYKLSLFTGTAGFIKKDEIPSLLLILLGNVIGCLIVSLMTRVSANDLQSAAQTIIQGRLDNGALKSGILAIGCGFIMTTAVTFARKGNLLPLLFGVPLFFFCGFPHCLVDAFYCQTIPFAFFKENAADILATYGCVVLGNFVGCNLFRTVLPDATV
jgi:formate/nitrite transporter FocA (FNT family)